MSWEPADSHVYYQFNNLKEALRQSEDAVKLIEETNICSWSLWWAKKLMKFSSNKLRKEIKKLEIKLIQETS